MNWLEKWEEKEKQNPITMKRSKNLILLPTSDSGLEVFRRLDHSEGNPEYEQILIVYTYDFDYNKQYAEDVLKELHTLLGESLEDLKKKEKGKAKKKKKSKGKKSKQ